MERRRFSLALMGAASLAAGGLLAGGSAQAQADSPGLDPEKLAALQRAADAVVGVRVTAVDDASSARTLGRRRQGSGVVIGDDGLVLTIGYLLLEAEQAEVLTDDGRVIPARVLGVDSATGLGLLLPLVPLRIAPAPLATTRPDPAQTEVMLLVTGGDLGAAAPVRFVARRAFSGSWEYHLDAALFTAPPRPNFAGAGLFNDRGELTGVGSLFVADATGLGGPPRVPGNMAVPVELLPPILSELRTQGRSSASVRPWIGVNCVEQDGGLRVVRVSEDSPAESGGVRAGDRIVGIDGEPVATLERLWKTLWRGGSPDKDVTLQLLRDGQPLALKLRAVDRAATLRRPQGV